MKFWEKTRKQIKLEGKDVVNNLKRIKSEIKTKKNLSWQIKTKIRELTNEIKSSEEYTRSLLEVHEERIKEALIEGKPIPIEVLKDYPNLKNNPKMKNPLPIGFGARLKELIAEGLPAKEAMKEVWREVKKSRTKTGVYSGSREIFGRKQRKNPKRITVTGFEDETTEDIQVDLHTREVAPSHLRDQKLMAAMREELYRRTQKKRYATRMSHGGEYPLGYKERNPKLQRGTYLDLSKASKTDLQHALDVASILRSNGFEKRANQIEKMVHRRKGFISVDASSALDSPAYKKVNPKRRKNPIAIYNPPGKQKLLYGRAYIPVIRGIKTNGKYKGERYQHNFSKSNEVSIYGNTDGSITVKSNNNIRLWDYDKDI